MRNRQKVIQITNVKVAPQEKKRKNTKQIKTRSKPANSNKNINNIKVVVNQEKRGKGTKRNVVIKEIVTTRAIPVSSGLNNLSSALLDQRLRDLHAPSGLSSHLPLLGRTIGTVPDPVGRTLYETARASPRSDVSSSGFSSVNLRTFPSVGDTVHFRSEHESKRRINERHQTEQPITRPVIANEPRLLRSEPPPRRLFNRADERPRTPPRFSQEAEPQTLDERHASLMSRLRDTIRPRESTVRDGVVSETYNPLTESTPRPPDLVARELRREILAMNPVPIHPPNTNHPRSGLPWTTGELSRISNNDRLRSIRDGTYVDSPVGIALRQRVRNAQTGRPFTRGEIEDLGAEQRARLFNIQSQT